MDRRTQRVPRPVLLHLHQHKRKVVVLGGIHRTARRRSAAGSGRPARRGPRRGQCPRPRSGPAIACPERTGLHRSLTIIDDWLGFRVVSTQTTSTRTTPVTGLSGARVLVTGGTRGIGAAA